MVCECVFSLFAALQEWPGIFHQFSLPETVGDPSTICKLKKEKISRRGEAPILIWEILTIYETFPSRNASRFSISILFSGHLHSCAVFLFNITLLHFPSSFFLGLLYLVATLLYFHILCSRCMPILVLCVVFSKEWPVTGVCFATFLSFTLSDTSSPIS